MRNAEIQEIFMIDKVKMYTKRHFEIINALEKLVEKGVPDLTM